MKKILISITAFAALLLPGRLQSQDYLLPAKLNGLFGYIDPRGSWIIPESYEQALPFSEGVAAVQYYGRWGFINRQGEMVIGADFSDAKPFSEGLACVKSGGKWGFIDHSGIWIIDPVYLAVSSFSEGKAVVFSETGFLFIDKDQNTLYNSGFRIARPFAESMAFVIKDNNKGFIDNNGVWLFETQFDDVYSYSEGLAMVTRSGKSGFINRRGEVKVRVDYDDATRFSQGLASVKVNKKWGYIDRSGDLAIQPSFDYAGPFENEFAVARMGDKYGLIDRTGDWVIRPKFGDLGQVSKTISLREEVEKMVTAGIREWERKGEFEKTSDYLNRVKKENRDKAIEEKTLDVIRLLAEKYITPGNAELGLYNADAEMFSVVIGGALPALLPVPIGEAEWVKNNWADAKIEPLNFSVYGENFLITELMASLKDKEYFYNASVDGVSASAFEITADLGEIVVSIPDMPVIMDYSRPMRKSRGTSDIDISIPGNPVSQDKVFAVVIGNEDYDTYQIDDNSDLNVDYAEVDARAFRDYLVKTFGVPEENITLLINATAGQINQSVAKLSALAKAYKGEAKLIFYYAGHGLPDERTREPYLVPVDVSGSDLEYAVSLENIYNRLTENEAERVMVFLDACFTGTGRGQGLVASRGIRIRPKSPFVLGNLIVFSATSSDQTAHAFHEKGHGMFTYHLLKKFQESNGQVKFGELAEYLENEVNRKSLLVNNQEQVPMVKVSPVFEYDWKDFTMMPELASW
ncbi:MAG TPA: WG repeat-containing protein [Cyclobacteriaceae bacterium]|nr:WG repeat-containing protein [Cyclobacteriaceae bacterium]